MDTTPTIDPGTDLQSKRRKGKGPTDFLTSSTPAGHDDELCRESVTPASHVPLDQDPKLLHHLDGCQIIRRSHIPFTSGEFCDIFIGDHQEYGKVAMRRPRMTEKGYSLGEVTRFLTESNIWKKLRHPNILQFIGLIQSDGYIWAVSRFAENGSLPTYIKDHPEINRLPLILQLADAIRYLHRQKVVHGDIKGSNILVSAAVTVLLCDFGLSKLSGSSTSTSLSGAASIRWCAPELLFDEATKTFSSDVYSFGMTVYEILSDKVPLHDIPNEVQAMQAINKGIRPPRVPPTLESGDSHEPLWDIASESWDGDPSNRPTMEAVCVRLGVPVQVTFSPGTTAKETSIDGGMFRHSGGFTSAHVAGDAMRGFYQSAAGDAPNYDEHPVPIQQPSIGRNEPTTSRSLTTEEDYRKKREDERLIIGLPRAHARYKDTSTKPSRPCHPGTRETLLKTLRDWINNDSSALFFWLCGEVGVGKTTVAHTIAMEQDALRQLAASFFFNRDNHHRRHPAPFATTLAYQLARFDANAYETVVSALRADPDIADIDLREQFQQLVVGSLGCLDGSSPSRKVVIVIDGLDECSNPVLLLDALSLLAEHTQSHLRVLVTSRPHSAIITKFKSTRLCHLTSETQFRDINSWTLKNDVRTYLVWSLGEIASEYSLPSSWPSPDQINKVVRMADGLFVLASIFDRYIRDPVEGNPAEQLECLLSRRQPVGGSPTADLDSMYDLVLDDLKRSLSKKDVVFARNVLQLAFLSSEDGLSVQEMADVLDRTPANVLSVLRRMTSVLRPPSGNDGCITPFHASFGEYIQDPERCSVSEFMIEPASSHGELATTFLEIFIRAADGGITGIEYDFSFHVPELFKLADRELHHHLRLASDPAPPQLRQAKDKFCGGAIWTWAFIWCSSYINSNIDQLLVKLITKSGLATACNIEDQASLQRWMVQHVLNQIPHLFVRQSRLADDREGDDSCIANDTDLQTFEIKLRWESGCWPFSIVDPRYFDRMLRKWSRIQHPNIVSLRRIEFEPLLDLSEGSTFHAPLTFHYPDLKCKWYPELREGFRRNSVGAVQTALGIAYALQHLLESGFYRISMIDTVSHFHIEDVVLSKEGKPMVHPAFLVYKKSLDPCPTDAERESLTKQGLGHWQFPGIDSVSRIVCDFGCVIYEMITGVPPLKRYDDLVKGRTRIDDETTVRHLLNDLQASGELKGVLQACWIVNTWNRPPIQHIVARLETILEGLGNHNGGAHGVEEG